MLCLTKYTTRGPSSRYRLLQFGPWLERRGIEIDVQPLHDDGYFTARFDGRRPSPAYLAGRVARRAAKLLTARRYDLVFIQKEIFPYLPGFAEWALERAGARLVLDIDDAIFLFYRGRRFLENKFAGVVSRCALVLAGNRYLLEYASRYTDRAVLFPTVVDSERFTPVVGHRGGDPVVGWIGSPTTSPYLQELRPALALIAERAPFSMRVVGAGSIALDGLTVESRPWSEEEEADDLRAMDVGVMPLPDTEWSRGKCALKLLQYMSAGLATVSSPRGSATEIIEDGDNGFLAATPGEWTERLTELLSDRELRVRMGTRAREWIESNYSMTHYGPKLADYLIAAAEGGGMR